jgi:porin
MPSWHALPLLAALLAVLLQPGWAHASVQNDSPPQKEDLQNAQRKQSRLRLLGDWKGTRTDLENAGLKVSPYYNYYFGILTRRGIHRHSGSADLFFHLDFEKMGWMAGAESLLQVKSTRGRNVNPEAGALSDPFDDADFDQLVYIDQFWFQKSFLDQKLQLRLGYIDQQTILDRNLYANAEDRQFMSAFLDNNNAIIPLKIGLGATLFINSTEWLRLILGTADVDNRVRQAGFNTAFDGFGSLMLYLAADLKGQWASPKGSPMPGNYRFGVFYDPRKKRVFRSQSPDPDSAELRGGDVGFYLSFDQALYRVTEEDPQGLGVFLRFGYRDDEVNQISRFWSAGFQYQGLLPRRDDDVLGLGFYSAHGSDPFRTYVNSDFVRETGLELYYNIQVTPWLTLTPDVQFIDQPGGLESVRDVLVFGLRVRVTF